MRLSRFKYNPSSLLIQLAALIAAFFLTTAAYDLWRYFRMEQQAIASVHSWKVIEKSPSQYAIKASYTFELQGKRYSGKTIFGKPYHLNRLSAEQQIKILSRQLWKTWYQPGDPKNSTLHKVFPAKKCLYALMAVGVSLYFLYIRHRYAPE